MIWACQTQLGGFRGPTGMSGGSYTVSKTTDDLHPEKYTNIFNYKEGITAYFNTLTVSGREIGISADSENIYLVGELPNNNFAMLGNTGELLYLYNGMSAAGALNTHWDNENEHLLARLISYREKYLENNNITNSPSNTTTSIKLDTVEGTSVPFTHFTIQGNQTCIECGFHLGLSSDGLTEMIHRFDEVCFEEGRANSGESTSNFEFGSCCYCENNSDGTDHQNCIDYVTESYCDEIGGIFNVLSCLNRPEGPNCYYGGACCVNSICIESSEDSCFLFGGYFIYDKTCLQVEEEGGCPDPCDEKGACCMGGYCFEKTTTECELEGGIWQGDGKNCYDLDVNCCSQSVIGACCLDEGCFETTAIECQSMLSEDGSPGVWWGEGSACGGPYSKVGVYSPYNCIITEGELAGTIGGTLDDNGRCGDNGPPPCPECLGWNFIIGDPSSDCSIPGYCVEGQEPSLNSPCCPRGNGSSSCLNCKPGCCSNRGGDNACKGSCCLTDINDPDNRICIEDVTRNYCESLDDGIQNQYEENSACFNGCGSICDENYCQENYIDQCNIQSSGTIILADGSCWECCCDQLDVLDDVGACCHSYGGEACSVLTSDQCNAIGGIYIGDHTQCNSDTCSLYIYCDDDNDCNGDSPYCCNGICKPLECGQSEPCCGVCCGNNIGGDDVNCLRFGPPDCGDADCANVADPEDICENSFSGEWFAPPADCSIHSNCDSGSGGGRNNNINEIGACCYRINRQFQCTDILTKSACEKLTDGTWRGAGTMCQDNPCDIGIQKTCCTKDGIGVNNFKHIIIAIDESLSVTLPPSCDNGNYHYWDCNNNCNKPEDNRTYKTWKYLTSEMTESILNIWRDDANLSGIGLWPQESYFSMIGRNLPPVDVVVFGSADLIDGSYDWSNASEPKTVFSGQIGDQDKKYSFGAGMDDTDACKNSSIIDTHSDLVKLIKHNNNIINNNGNPNTLVILISDGNNTPTPDPTTGILNPDIQDFISDPGVDSPLGMYVTIGLGDEVNANYAANLKSISKYTDGLHYYGNPTKGTTENSISPFLKNLWASILSCGQLGLGTRGFVDWNNRFEFANDYCNTEFEERLCDSYRNGGNYPSWSNPTWYNPGSCSSCNFNDFIHSCCYNDGSCDNVCLTCNLKSKKDCIDNRGIFKEYKKCNCGSKCSSYNFM